MAIGHLSLLGCSLAAVGIAVRRGVGLLRIAKWAAMSALVGTTLLLWMGTFSVPGTWLEFSISTMDRVDSSLYVVENVGAVVGFSAVNWDGTWSKVKPASFGPFQIDKISSGIGAYFSVKSWVPASVLTACILTHFAIRSRRRRVHPDTACPTCGYDLRATPDRCPECGRVPADLVPAKPS